MENSSELNPSCGLRRRSVGPDNASPNLPLNLEVGFKIVEGGVIKGTPSPGHVRIIADDDPRPSSSLAEFRKKQQSFEIHIEDCDEEEMSGGSSDEGGSRPVTPAQPQHMQFSDCSGNVTYKETAPQGDFLQVGERDLECLTDVSEGESDNEDEMEEAASPKCSVIKRVPS